MILINLFLNLYTCPQRYMNRFVIHPLIILLYTVKIHEYCIRRKPFEIAWFMTIQRKSMYDAFGQHETATIPASTILLFNPTCFAASSQSQ